MNNMLMQRIVDEVVFRVKQRAENTRADCFSTARRQRSRERSSVCVITNPICRSAAAATTCGERNVRSSSNPDTRSVSLGMHIQLSLQRHFLNAIELKTLARLPLSWCDEQGQPIYLHRDRLLSYADIAQLSSGILVLQRKCCVTALAREAAITRNIQLIRQE